MSLIDWIRQQLGVHSPSLTLKKHVDRRDNIDAFCQAMAAGIKAPLPLQIAFLGYNELQTRQYFRQFIRDNAEQIRAYSYDNGWVKFIDGTLVLRVSSAPEWIRARRFDQIIVADDWRKMTYINRMDELDALDVSCRDSIIPLEFRFQFYYIDEEAPA